jgi:hypothetical protein
VPIDNRWERLHAARVQKNEHPLAPHTSEATLPATAAFLASALLFGVSLAVFGALHQRLWAEEPWSSLREWMFWPPVVLSMFVHEALHAVGFRWVGAPRSHVHVGFGWRRPVPTAECDAPLPAKKFRRACVLPAMALGLLPVVVGLSFGFAAVTMFGILMLGASGGDAAVLWAIRKVGPDARLLDHPTAVGCRVWVDDTNPRLADLGCTAIDDSSAAR